MTEQQLRAELDAYCRVVGPMVYQLRLEHADKYTPSLPCHVFAEFWPEPKPGVKERYVFAAKGATFPEAFHRLADFVRRKTPCPARPFMEGFRELLVGRDFTPHEAALYLLDIRLEIAARTR